MKLFEIKATPYPYTIESLSDYYADGRHARFTTNDGSLVQVYLTLSESQSLVIYFTRDNSFDLSGTGDQFKILFTVLDIIQKHVPDLAKNAKKISFSADKSEPTRVKLYKNRLAPEITRILGTTWNGPVISTTQHDVEFNWTQEDQ